MKTVVSVNEITELEIKPQRELDEWKKLVGNEIAERWLNSDKMQEVPCPVCNNKVTSDAFVKLGFHYAECDNCKTIYATRRPLSEELQAWYNTSKSVEYWYHTLLKSSAASRKAKIIEPRAQWILDGISEYIPISADDKISVTDISFFGGALADTLAELSDNIQITSAGVMAGIESYQSQSITVKPLVSFDMPSNLDQTDVLVAIDLLDRVQNINHFFSLLENVVKPGGVFFGTCLVSSGFEIQALWGNASSIIPPDKLNLPSVQSLIDHFSKSQQWEILELSTPGMFDAESVKREMGKNDNVTWPRSLKVLLDNINKQGIGLFTEYLQSQRLSSFARIVLRRSGHNIY